LHIETLKAVTIAATFGTYSLKTNHDTNNTFPLALVFKAIDTKKKLGESADYSMGPLIYAVLTKPGRCNY
jgi:hypothetical protein